MEGLRLLFWLQTQREVGNDQKALCQEDVLGPRAGGNQGVRPGLTYGQCPRQDKRVSRYSLEVWSPRKQGLTAQAPWTTCFLR